MKEKLQFPRKRGYGRPQNKCQEELDVSKLQSKYNRLGEKVKYDWGGEDRASASINQEWGEDKRMQRHNAWGSGSQRIISIESNGQKRMGQGRMPGGSNRQKVMVQRGMPGSSDRQKVMAQRVMPGGSLCRGWRLGAVASLCFGLLCLFLLFPLPAQAQGMIAIDANRRYEGMGASFAKGYEPAIHKDTMTLVVPFLAKMEVENHRLQVGVSFEKEENSPFYYKNYQKRVKESEDGVYLYQCKLKLKKDRVNGQYPLHLLVQAQTGEGVVQQDFTVYVEISDGRPQPSAEGEEAGVPEEGGGSLEPVLPDTGASQPLGESVQQEETVHQPRIMVVSNSLQGMALQAGESSLWAVEVKNCSSRQPIFNLKITLLCEADSLSFEKASWYFERVAAGQSLDLSQNITVSRKAAAEAASLQLQFDYEDRKGTAYNAAESLSLPVRQVQQAELASLTFPESIYESDTGSLAFQVQNTGLAVIYNAKVRLEGKGLFPQKELFLGNMEAGTSLDGEIPVFAGTLDMDADGNIIEGGGEKYGDTIGTVIFSYEDEQGKAIEQSQKVHTSIKKPQVVELKVEKEPEKTNQWWITIIILVAAAMALVIAWLYLRMKHYQRMGMEAS